MSVEDLSIRLLAKHLGTRIFCQRTVLSLSLFCYIIILKYAIKVEAKLRWSSEQMAFGFLAAANWWLS